MKKKFFALILVMMGVFRLFSPTAAQEGGDPLVLDFNREFGYGGFGGEIQGRFSLRVESPEDIVRVAYYLDDELVYEGNEPPFKWQFNTAEFPEGRHTFSAVGYKADGAEIHAEPFERVFLTSEQAWSQTGNLIVPILVVVGLTSLVGVLGPVVLGRKKAHRPGIYGLAGGAICPRCAFPYSRHVLAPNMVVGKLERCPHCGKWAVVSRASAAQLEAAEKRLAAEDSGIVETLSEEERLRQMIEESRFEE